MIRAISASPSYPTRWCQQ